MNRSNLLRVVTTAACMAATTTMLGQTNSTQVFGPTDVRLSTSGTGFGPNEAIYNSSTILLNCSAAPVQAVLSSTPDGTGNVLVDNFIDLTVGSGSSVTPVNVCTGGLVEPTPAGLQNDCFNQNYASAAAPGLLTGQDPDTFASTDGVPPINISSSIPAGLGQIKIDLVDTGSGSGYYLASSSIYLNTNCTVIGVTGPGNITGNPISQTNPTPAQLKQNFSFDSSTNKQVEFTYDLSLAQSSGTLTITDGTIPNTADIFIDPATFQPVYVPGTSFATSSCLVHTGELLPNGSPACKLYTLECLVGTGSNQSGAQCPVSQARNEIFQEVFDGPPFTLPDIINPNGPTFHQGVGFLMASEGWTGGSCLFDPASGLGSLLCPQNLLVNFSGPGAYAGTGLGTHPNSSFIAVAPVPEDLTTVSVVGQLPGGWINSPNATVNFSSLPPSFSSQLPPVPGQSNFVAAPISTITYGISPASSVPSPGPAIPTDTVLTNTIPCPVAGGPPGSPTVFTPPAQTLTGLADGQYLIHYFAQDCAGTEELHFLQGAEGSWSTSFYTAPLNVDTVAPLVVGLTLSPAPSTNSGVPNSYALNQKVTASYNCTDERSGVVTCGSSTFSPGTLNTGLLSATVDTSTPGTKTFTVNATDAAGNQATPASVTYQVVAPPVNLVILKVAPLSVLHNSVFTYNIAAGNFSSVSASSVVITDPLPAGVTFVSATAQVFSCTVSGCSTSPGGTSCSYANNTVTCSTSSLVPITWSSFAELGVEITVRATGASGTTLTNTATIKSANPIPSPGLTHSTATTKIK